MRTRASWSQGPAKLLLLSIVFHAVYIKSIFDIYFQSPVISVSKRWNVGNVLDDVRIAASESRLAKRVVLIVADGLRADKLFQCYDDPPFDPGLPLPASVPASSNAHASCGLPGKTTPAPFLRGLIQRHEARWGVSHTRVPTESRPGHVALIGGMYEDVSAVTRGWQHNPVPFDSVFNQSSKTWSFGSPDILPMFRDGASDPERVKTWSYSEEDEDFTKDAVHLDLWVLERLRELFMTSEPRMHDEGSVFFLHLLGLDTTGHSYRPHGPEYHRNIRVVDYVARQTTELINAYYGDSETAFVFTADHGMSNKGNHGDGEPDNTRTPLVTWGAGINTAMRGVGTMDSYSKAWGLNGPRVDVEQAGIAVLMATLGGLNIPANSAGRLPSSYLKASLEYKARAMLANARQVLEQYRSKRDLRGAHSIRFRPFSGLANVTDSKSDQTRLREIHFLMTDGRWVDAEHEARKLLDLAAQGVDYFQTYDWLLLRSIVAMGYLAFMLYTVMFLRGQQQYSAVNASLAPGTTGPLLSLVAFLSFSARFAIERSPLAYYLYVAFPCFFFGSVLRHSQRLFALLSDTCKPKTLFTCAVVIATLQATVESFQHREILSGLIVGSLIWTTNLPGFKGSRATELYTLFSLLLAVFPLLPVEKGESIPTIVFGGLAFMTLATVGSRYARSTRTVRYLRVETILTLASILIATSSARGLQLKRGLPLLNQAVGWLLLVVSTIVPVVHGRPRQQAPLDRVFVIATSFCPAIVMLSLSYEALFYATYAATLVLWLAVEIQMHDAQRHKSGSLTLDHARIAMLFLLYLHIGFFGVGNVASISSFYLEPVYRLMTVFAPFPMAVLLVFKLLIPFVALSAVTNVLNRRLALPPFSLFILASLMAELMTLNFFFRVKNTGSWLEIGSTITNFAICSLLSIFNTGLYLLGTWMMAHTA